MCLAIYKPKNQTIPKEYLLYASEVNSDGIGLAYADKKGLNVYKSDDPKKFKKFFDVLEKDLKSFDCLVHLRYATRGYIEKENCHPFINEKKNLALIHNGTFHDFGSHEHSDTKEFCEKLAFPIFAKTGYSKGFLNLMEHFAKTQKLATIDHNGKVIVYNPSSWIQRNGVFYSNSYSLPQDSFKKYRKKKDEIIDYEWEWEKDYENFWLKEY